MGTSWSVRFVAPAGITEQAIEAEVLGRLDAINAEMSHWRPDSRISDYNRSTGGSRISLSPDFARVMETAIAIARDSDAKPAYDTAVKTSARADEIMASSVVIDRNVKLADAMPQTRSSTAQDIAKGRPTEIAHLNGYVVRAGEARGVATPVNEILNALIKLLWKLFQDCGIPFPASKENAIKLNAYGVDQRDQPVASNIFPRIKGLLLPVMEDATPSSMATIPSSSRRHLR